MLHHKLPAPHISQWPPLPYWLDPKASSTVPACLWSLQVAVSFTPTDQWNECSYAWVLASMLPAVPITHMAYSTTGIPAATNKSYWSLYMIKT